MEMLESVSYETMRFMRGNYRLDEIGDGKDELKFRQGKKTILTIYLHETYFSFLIIFGKTEREAFDTRRDEFSPYVTAVYDAARTYHDGKWMSFDVSTLDQLEEMKKLIKIKKKPNRKPFSQAGAVAAQCGQRCDLCIHYTGMEESLRAQIEPLLVKMWDKTDWSMRCKGCDSDDCYCKDDPCYAKSCVAEKKIANCTDCEQHPCARATSADYRSRIHTEVHMADEITWAILPYVPYQYEK